MSVRRRPVAPRLLRLCLASCAWLILSLAGALDLYCLQRARDFASPSDDMLAGHRLATLGVTVAFAAKLCAIPLLLALAKAGRGGGGNGSGGYDYDVYPQYEHGGYGGDGGSSRASPAGVLQQTAQPDAV